jgi:hypothetical protein
MTDRGDLSDSGGHDRMFEQHARWLAVDEERSNTVAEVMEDGFIQVGEHLCGTVDRAAREDQAEAGSGWEYWQAHLDSEDEPVTLVELRERALSRT